MDNNVILQLHHILVIIQLMLQMPEFITQNIILDLIQINKNYHALIEYELVIKKYFLALKMYAIFQIEQLAQHKYNLTLQKDQQILAMLVKCRVEILENELFNVVVILVIY